MTAEAKEGGVVGDAGSRGWVGTVRGNGRVGPVKLLM